MGAYGSISTGYDPGYLLRESSKGMEGYYLSAITECGEPPGVWTGRACPALGLAAGAEVEPKVMELLYGQLLDPRDPAFADDEIPAGDKEHLGAAPRHYKTITDRYAALLAAEPDATPERREQPALQARKQARQAVMFLDYTFSAAKSISVLHASLQAAAIKAERAGDAAAAAGYRRQAQAVEDAVRAGAAAALDYLQDEAGYSRAGYHGAVPKDEQGRPLAQHATGRFVDAHQWVIASFLQHTSRDGDPQLHVHNAILNRAECQDGTWRTLDSRGLHRARAAATAIGGRVMDEQIARELRAAFAQTGEHARELTGVPQQVCEMFSSRRAVISAGVAELAAEYQARHGRAPSARALFSMAQHVTLSSRRAKPRKRHAPTRAELLDQWAAQVTAAELGAVDGIPARVTGSLDPAAPGLAGLADEEIARVLAVAVADVQAGHAVWGRGQLLAAIDAQLPGWLGGLDAAAVRRVLDELTSHALDPASGYGVVSLEAPDLVPMPAALRRSDGRSIYSPHDRALYTTRPQLDREEQLLAAAGQQAAPAASPARAAAALGISPAALGQLPRRRPPASTPAGDQDQVPDQRRYAGGLRADQAAAVLGILTGGRPVEVLIGPAGTGKSRTMGTLAALWAGLAGGLVVGVATSENAAQVLGAEGVGEAWNIAKFLARAARSQAVLGPGDLLIVDEAGMVPTADLTALHHLAADAGATVLLTGDPAQLPAVGAGGALAMLARDHGFWQLTQVQRMAEQWEREASLRLRDGDTSVIADYDRHGRLSEGTPEQAGQAAYRGWLADYLDGKTTLLIAATTAQAAELSARARAELAELGLVDHGQITLSDRNQAGIGDLIQARHNDRSIEDQAGRWIANRDVLRITAVSADPETGEVDAAVVQRDLGRDPETHERQWSAPFAVPRGYLENEAVLGYATTVHAAQGRTVDTCHAVVTELLTRALVYVAMTRGRLANYAYIVTEPAARAAQAAASETAGQRRSTDLRPGARPAPALAADPGTPWAPEADRFSVLIGAIERDEADTTALQVQRDETTRQRHLAHIGAEWADLAAEESGRRYDALLTAALTPGQHARYLTEEARPTLHRQVRTAELAGHDPARLLPRAVAASDLDHDPHRGPADSIAKVLHYRIKRQIGEPVPRPASFTDRTPQAADPQTGTALHHLAALADDRQHELGERAAHTPPRWAARLGPVPPPSPEPPGPPGPDHAAPGSRQEWISRAGAIAAYREMYGFTDPEQPIGREPDAPEARAAWHAAAQALGPEAGRDVARLSEGELHARLTRYEREQQTAPPHVGDQLRTTALARREHAADATLTRARARAASGPDRDQLTARADAHARLARTLADREQRLARADADRASWYQQTAQAREQAAEAAAELGRRHPEAPVERRDDQPPAAPQPGPDRRPPAPDEPRRWPHAGALTRHRPAPARPEPEDQPAPEPPGTGHDRDDLHQAATAAAQARRAADRAAREHDADDRDRDQRDRDEPDRTRWPHRDPGYPHREQPEQPEPRERTAADIAAQNFPNPPHAPHRPGRDAAPRPPDPPERYRRPPEPPKRDGPSPSR